MKKLLIKITLITLCLVTIPLHASFFTTAWNAIKRHPLIASGAAISTAAYLVANRYKFTHTNTKTIRTCRTDERALCSLGRALIIEKVENAHQKIVDRYKKIPQSAIDKIQDITTIPEDSVAYLVSSINQYNHAFEAYKATKNKETIKDLKGSYQEMADQYKQCRKEVEKAMTKNQAVNTFLKADTIETVGLNSLLMCSLCAALAAMVDLS